MTDKPSFSKLETTDPALLQGGGSRGGSIKGVRAFDTTYRNPNDKKAASSVSAKSAATPTNSI
jgi:hypothetical protein